MSRRILIIGLITVCVIAVAYFGIAQLIDSVRYNQQNATLQVAPTTNVTHIDITTNMTYQPANVQVKVGTTVTWTNMDSTPHSITLDDGSKDSGLLAQNASFSYTFTSVGTFQYHCSAHPYMLGKITVTQ